jgi:hypothetical protein
MILPVRLSAGGNGDQIIHQDNRLIQLYFCFNLHQHYWLVVQFAEYFTRDRQSLNQRAQIGYAPRLGAMTTELSVDR